MPLRLSRGIMRDLGRVYGSLTGEVVRRLATPPKRLYARVNTLRASRSDVIKELNREGIEGYSDDFVEDAIYFEVRGPFRVECKAVGRIVVDARTAVSLMLGANLYRPGVIKSTRFHKGDLLLATTREGIVVACVEAAVSYSDMVVLERGLVGINVTSPYRAPRLAETLVYSKGLIYSQSLPSIVTTHVINPREGELIIDVNAAPGGKTSHIVQITRGKALVVAFDRSVGKIRALQLTLKRLQLESNVIAIPWDSRYVHLDLNLRGKADRVLIDPPCSNLGVRPLVESKEWSSVENLSEYQKQFLRAAAELLKQRGLLVYSTCTLTFRENEENVVYAVEELGLNSAESEIPVPYAEKITYKNIVAYRYSPLAHDMPGYFIAILEK
ncbi:MAG: PUA domain-containing protein [Desulfurococcaceae archaeon]